MSREIVQKAVEQAQSTLELSLKSSPSDRVHLGNGAIITLLSALLLEVAELRAELAARKSE
jgi:hypothetical protein